MSTHSWEALCILAFLLLISVPLKKFLASYLDKHADAIRDKLKGAEDLYAEAEKVTRFYQAQHQKFTEQAELMNANTQHNINKLREDAKELLENKVRLKKLLHEEKLAVYKAEEINKIKTATIMKAVLLTKLYLKDHLKKITSKEEIDEAFNFIKNKKVSLH